MYWNFEIVPGADAIQELCSLRDSGAECGAHR